MRLSLFIFCISMFGLAQCQSKQKEMEKKYGEIYKQVKVYDKNPCYIAEVSSNNCSFKLLTNDMPDINFAEPGDVNPLREKINPSILKSGKQIITIRVYPPMLSKRPYSMAEIIPLNASINVDIVCSEKDDQLYNNKKVSSINCPMRKNANGDSIFAGAGLPYFEFSDTVMLDVPYTLKGWSESVDLTKLPKEELEKKVIDAYKKEAEIKLTRNIQAELSANYEKSLEIFQAFYWNAEKDNIEDKIALLEDLTKETYKPYQIGKYSMEFFGNGRVVALVSKELKSFNETALILHNDKRRAFSYFQFYLHMKPGSNELTQIR